MWQHHKRYCKHAKLHSNDQRCIRNSGRLKTNSDTICSYTIDHMKVLLHVYNTFYGAVTYYVVNLHVNNLILNLWEKTIFKMAFLHSVAVSW